MGEVEGGMGKVEDGGIVQGDIKHTVEEFADCPMLQPRALETRHGAWSWGRDEDCREIQISVCSARENGLVRDIWPVPPVIVDMIRPHAKNEVDKRLREIRRKLGI